MDKANKLLTINEGYKLPPLRDLNEFILESSRFQFPNFRDLEKWGNRVVNNLVYYQTNYLYMWIAIIFVVVLIHPMKGIIGTSTLIAMFSVYFYVSNQRESLNKFKKSYPQVGIILAIVCGIYIFITINSLLFVLFGVLLSVCVTFIHASLRLRNLKNKVLNKIEGMGLERTPMGLFLSNLGMKVELFT